MLISLDHFNESKNSDYDTPHIAMEILKLSLWQLFDAAFTISIVTEVDMLRQSPAEHARFAAKEMDMRAINRPSDHHDYRH